MHVTQVSPLPFNKLNFIPTINQPHSALTPPIPFIASQIIKQSFAYPYKSPTCHYSPLPPKISRINMREIHTGYWWRGHGFASGGEPSISGGWTRVSQTARCGHNPRNVDELERADPRARSARVKLLRVGRVGGSSRRDAEARVAERDGGRVCGVVWFWQA